jgi:hypothetical protein
VAVTGEAAIVVATRYANPAITNRAKIRLMITIRVLFISYILGPSFSAPEFSTLL